MSTPFVAILMGSDSDLPTMQATQEVLAKLGIAHEMKITSAHRTPALAARIKNERDANCADVLAKDKALQDKLRRG